MSCLNFAPIRHELSPALILAFYAYSLTEESIQEVLQISMFETTLTHSEPNTFISKRQKRIDALAIVQLHIPEEFICNLSAQVMDDPVKLPSGEACERTVITRVIEESGRNPYTRAPLSIIELEPCEELSERIESFLRQLESNQEDASGAAPGP